MKIFSLINRISALTNFFSAGNTQKINSNLLKYGLVLLFSVTLWGCGKGNPAAVTIDPSTGKHATGWAVGAVGGSHVDAFFATKTVGSSCVGCHGTPQDPIGGIVKVSCSSVSRDGMNCHGGLWPHGDVPYIPQAFDTPTVHGQQVVNNGLATCQKCHGVDYKGLPGLGVNCIACHQTVNPANNAPHAFDWTTGTLKHSATNQLYAPACGECHYFPNNPASTANTPRTV
ncbi:MAG: hypothetical protein M0T70_07840, partial [Geobacteraceae bacterium]|nr:hypothetical protein [Geobacteraceae bacterium]